MERIYITKFEKYKKSEIIFDAIKKEAAEEDPMKVLLLCKMSDMDREVQGSAESFYSLRIPKLQVVPIKIGHGRKKANIQLMLDLLENMPEGSLAHYDLTFADQETAAMLLFTSDYAERLKDVQAAGIYCGDRDLTYLSELNRMVRDAEGFGNQAISVLETLIK